MTAPWQIFMDDGRVFDCQSKNDVLITEDRIRKEEGISGPFPGRLVEFPGHPGYSP